MSKRETDSTHYYSNWITSYNFVLGDFKRNRGTLVLQTLCKKYIFNPNTGKNGPQKSLYFHAEKIY